MKKTTLLLAGVLLSSALLVGTTSTLAATSNGTITFDTGTGAGRPSDPNDPSQENPNNPTDTGERGPLILKVVPFFDFGTQTVSATATVYPDQEPITNYIEVRDNRDATVDGWSVTASRTTFASGDLTLPATLSIPQGVIRNSNPTAAQGNAAGTTTSITNNSIESFAGDIPVGPDNTLTVLETEQLSNEIGKANTTSALAEGDSRAQLSVPAASASSGTFASTITWTVTAGASA